MADKRGKGTGGADANVVAFADAARDLARQRRRRPDPPPTEKREGAPAGKWTPNALGLPREDECPVEPIGIEGNLFHLIDSARQFRTLAAGDFSHAGIQSLFAGAPNFPKWMCPRYGRAPKAEDGEPPPPPPIKSFEDDQVRELLFRACQLMGLFSPEDKLRGRGCWMLEGGQLLYHAGEELWICENGRIKPPVDTGMYPKKGAAHLYPRLAALPPPWDRPVTPADNPARALIEIFRKWNWWRPAVDPVLLLGWIGCAYLGAALDWRPSAILIGDKNTGKSTLQQAMIDLFGDALFTTDQTTEAAVAQSLARDCRPVALDELEADADPRKVQAIIQLIRIAASGGTRTRGGQDHSPTRFTLRSAFLASAINNPIQASQDLSRIAVLRLHALDPAQPKPPAVNAETCGRMVLAILMRGWPRFAATRDAYMQALHAGGHDGRGQKTYGTLLACADLLLGHEVAADLGVPLTEDLAWWTEHLSVENLPEVEDASSNWRGCLTHLLTAPVEVWRSGARITIGGCLDEMARETQRGIDCNYGFAQARSDLGKTGLGLLPPGAVPGVPPQDGCILAVPGKHPALNRLFAGTVWAGQVGHGGPWRDALRQAPAHIVVGPIGADGKVDKNANRVTIDGVRLHCALVVLSRFHAASER